MVVVGVLTYAAQINVLLCLIWELTFYEFELGHDAADATKKNCGEKGEIAVHHSTITKWFKKLHLGCKTLNNQAKLSWPKTTNSKAMLQAIAALPASSYQRVSGKLHISQSSVIRHLHNLGKNIWSSWIVAHITKVLLNF